MMSFLKPTNHCRILCRCHLIWSHSDKYVNVLIPHYLLLIIQEILKTSQNVKTLQDLSIYYVARLIVQNMRTSTNTYVRFHGGCQMSEDFTNHRCLHHYRCLLGDFTIHQISEDGKTILQNQYLKTRILFSGLPARNRHVSMFCL